MAENRAWGNGRDGCLPAARRFKYPWGDSNARNQLRRLVLYPPELQGHVTWLPGDRETMLIS